MLEYSDKKRVCSFSAHREEIEMMKKAGKFLCLILTFAFVLGAGAFSGARVQRVCAEDNTPAPPAFETVPGSPLADEVAGGTGVLSGFLPGTTASTVRGNFTTAVSIFRADGTTPVKPDEVVHTGDVVKNTAVADAMLSIAIIGDVTGDGMVSAADCAALKFIITDTSTSANLPQAYSSAADVNHDEDVAAEDYVALKKQLKGMSDTYKFLRGKQYQIKFPLPKYGSERNARLAVPTTDTALMGYYKMHDDYPAGLNGMYCLVPTDSTESFWINPTFNKEPVDYRLVRRINKYNSAEDAANQVNAAADVLDDHFSYCVYKGYPNGKDGMLNIARKKFDNSDGNVKGFWINPSENAEKLNYKTMKALWISQFDMYEVYVNGGTQRAENDCRAKIKKTLETVRSCGYNTVMVQVHPNGDSFFQSDHFPWSKYVTGAYGTAGTYSPFDIVIDEAQKLALSVHAWVNPMRLMSVTDIESIGTGNTIGQWHADSEKEGKYIVPVGKLYYLNPGYEDVRNLIVNGVTEVCSKAIDGVHFDDYFYPEGVTNDFDKEAYEASNQNSLPQYRISCVNDFVKRVYTVCHNNGIVFGISPAGTVSVNDSAYADVGTWCRGTEYVDYMAPQLYWGLEGTGSKFGEKLEDWENLVRGHEVKLVPAMTLGYASKGDPQEWAEHKDVIKREMRLAENCTNFGGVMIFSLKDFYNPVNSSYTTQLTAERANYEPVLKAMHVAS